jgi:hypothetical protein
MQMADEEEGTTPFFNRMFLQRKMKSRSWNVDKINIDLKFYLKRNILKVGSVSIGPSTPSKVILSQDKDWDWKVDFDSQF